ncbi:transmembrane protein 130 isoform X1 [Rousettus aegyptiacus]|uniref:Transmembrane protein 130 n=1 Tax=Rousettus aegyptiacus TaxID=9407 RepID=A0A7J8FND4_ROUAE|nr:transmembrane protein 130 isoform X1 [Rousettus aegyptiacus]KAF6449160.1 transmembrane protein 130 [Rousettus aegyptiacus]
MAPALWPRVGSILWLACLLPWAPAAVAAGLYELHLAADSPAITGVEASITASLVASDNGSLVLPTSFHSYRFHWLHTPLLLTGKSDEAFSSTIRAVGNAPGDFPVSVWVTAANCWMCQPVARSLLVLSITESLTGNIVIMQNTSLPWPNYLAKTALKISFILHDPSNFFKTASFLYSWDFGDGTQMITEDSVVYYNYSIIGAATVKLRVVAEWEQATLGAAGKGVAQKTGDFSTSLKLQETLRGIQVSGPTQLQNFQKMTVTLNFLGSPPLTLCWRLKHECLPLEEGECHPVSVAGTAYNLTYVFREPGDYCFSIRAQNVISKTHQYHRIQVWPSSMQPAVFAFPCATLITMVLALIMYLTLRHATHQKDMVEVADFDFSPMSDKNLEPPTGVKCCCQTCCRPFFLETPSEYLEVVRGSHGLLPPFYKSAKTYTV